MLPLIAECQVLLVKHKYDLLWSAKLCVHALCAQSCDFLLSAREADVIWTCYSCR